MTHKIVNHQGIALIQVLLITAILSVLALYLSSTAKDQVNISQWSNDKADALVAIQSAESQLLFSLLTEPRVTNTNKVHPDNTLVNRWNFYGKVFTYNPIVNITIQDQAGLISAHSPNRNILQLFITANGYSMTEARSMFDSLLDWQDVDSIPRTLGNESQNRQGTANIRNGPIPYLLDFSNVKGFTDELTQTMVKNTTIHSAGYFNPINSPAELLSALSDINAVQQVLLLRKNNQLTEKAFTDLTGIKEDDETFFYSSNKFAILLQAQIGSAKVTKEITVELNAYALATQPPINLLSNRG